MDEVIFEEFKGTGNMELVLDRKISDRRVYPHRPDAIGNTQGRAALDPGGTQPDVDTAEIPRDNDPIEMMEFLMEKITNTKTNREFLDAMKSWIL